MCEAMTVSSSHPLLTSADVVALLQRHFDHLAAEFHVASLDLFGSYAHGEQTPESDVDLLVSFSQPVGFGFIHLAERLETLLGKPVDLLAADGIKPNRRDAILSSVIHVAP
jgi:predicted nucleotidyltransferase